MINSKIWPNQKHTFKSIALHLVYLKAVAPPTLECGSSCVVVNEVLDPLFSKSHLPAKWEWQLVSHGEAWVLPLSRLALVVDKVDTLIWQHTLFCIHVHTHTQN